MIPTRAELPEATTASKIKALIGHDKTASVFVRLAPHAYDKKCACHACEREPKGDWKPIPWTGRQPRRLFVRFDVGARNVRFKLTGGEHFVVVADCDVSDFLAELIDRDRRGMMLALPLTVDRITKREVEAA
jgi:hypothetical protein